MFCGKAFPILGPEVARLLSPKVVDLRTFTEISSEAATGGVL